MRQKSEAVYGTTCAAWDQARYSSRKTGRAQMEVDLGCVELSIYADLEVKQAALCINKFGILSFQQVPHTPHYSLCKPGSNWSEKEYNWCQLPWCYVP